VAVDVLGALSFSGSSDANNEDEALALVSSCAALLCLLSTERFVHTSDIKNTRAITSYGYTD